jgi:hypothetical protein
MLNYFRADHVDEENMKTFPQVKKMIKRNAYPRSKMGDTGLCFGSKSSPELVSPGKMTLSNRLNISSSSYSLFYLAKVLVKFKVTLPRS